MSLVKRHPIITFFVLAYAIAWGFVPFGSFGAFAPLIAALIVIPLTQGWSGLRELGSRMIRWRVRWYWYVVAIVVPLAVHLITVGLNVAAGVGIPPQGFTSLTGFLLIFAVRLVNPLDGPLGEDPGWRGFALPGLQGLGYSPLLATVILAVLITGWHLPLFFMGGGLPLSIVVTSILTTAAVTFWYTWIFNRTGGSVLLVILAHNLEGSIQAEGWVYMGVWLAVAIGLVVFNWQAWRAPAAAETTTPQTIPPRGAAPATPA
jgi:uncharacterized protein